MKLAPAGAARFWAKVRSGASKSAAGSFGLFLLTVAAGLTAAGLLASSLASRQEAKVQSLSRESVLQRALLDRQGDIERDLAGLEAGWAGLSRRLIREPAQDVALAAVQRTIEAVAGQNGVVIRSYRFEDVRTTGRFSVLPVSLEFSSDFESLAKLLQGIETAEPLLVISDLEIVSPWNNAQLNVRMVVEGFRTDGQTSP